MTRRIIYVSGARADFGLIRSTLLRAAQDPRLALSVCVTGMHLLDAFGSTVSDIEAAGLPIVARISVELHEGDGAAMSRALAVELSGMTEAFLRARPDAVLVLGDRGEMLAGALAAVHLNIPVVHIHGGERSGTIDEPIRHAISKLAHYHFVATPGARERLIRMGERSETVFVTGAPGLDGIEALARRGREVLCRKAGLDPLRPVALLVFHPVVQEAHAAGDQAREVLRGILSLGFQVLALMPNADAGHPGIRAALSHAVGPGVQCATHLDREDFVSWMAAADVMVGNSSAGIIEAASVGCRVVNIGSRQTSRERSGNTIDCKAEAHEVAQAIRRALELPPVRTNVYGDGRAGERIVELLATLSLSPDLLQKTNAY